MKLRADAPIGGWPLGRHVEYRLPATKRIFDLVLASIALIVLAPIMAVIAALVRLDSPGPILYGQKRIGYAGTPFTLFKFRSMKYQASDEHHRRVVEAWFNGAPAPNGYKAELDPRITRFGRFLRSTSLDELPQLINVVRGEMSIVGPRPGIEYERQYYEPWYYERELALPGITGLWQVSGRDRLAAAAMMALDVEYVRNRSLLLDLKIILRTFPALLSH
jgi:lipopolysaccharide/colanic/teichoic acid biosynthesis glycosyltransferase